MHAYDAVHTVPVQIRGARIHAYVGAHHAAVVAASGADPTGSHDTESGAGRSSGLPFVFERAGASAVALHVLGHARSRAALSARPASARGVSPSSRPMAGQHASAGSCLRVVRGPSPWDRACLRATTTTRTASPHLLQNVCCERRAHGAFLPDKRPQARTDVCPQHLRIRAPQCAPMAF